MFRYTYRNIHIGIVTDKEKRVCVDPEGNGAIMNEGGEGGPGPPGRG
jgi:hypothetical protein